MVFAQVLVNVKADSLDRLLTYRVPASLVSAIKPGVMVKIPLGKKFVHGWVWKVDDKEEKLSLPAEIEIKEVSGLVENSPVLSPEALQLAGEVSKRYYCRLLDALQLFLPPSWEKVKVKKTHRLFLSVKRDSLLEQFQQLQKKAPRQAEIIQLLLTEGDGIELYQVINEKGCSRQAVNALLKKKIIAKEEERFFRNPLAEEEDIKTVAPVHSFEQEKALQAIETKLDSGKNGEFLIYGVTGSGKTEVYLRGVEMALNRKMGAIVLIPEIALTPQMVKFFAGRFGNQLAVLHSRLSQGERYDEWWRIYQGEARVVLGARSAVFAPLAYPGLIIIDEEHELSYKQEESPRYHARDIARWRCGYHNGLLLLGSATPSLESYHRSSSSSETIFLRKRIGNKPLPKVDIVDMRRELKEGHKSIFSRKLLQSMEEAFQQKEQVVLFLNRRGYASFVLCRSCGYVERCHHCEVSLTYHHYLKKLTCHYCSFKTNVPIRCSSCYSPYVKLFGVGTQRLEQEVKKHFPGIGVIRVDADTTTKKGAHKALLGAFSQQKASVLIGTQMIAKGLNFPEVTLVGVVAADVALNFPDFRAGERTFQLLTQVAGRAGRGEKEGKVVIQTYAPKHESIVNAANHDYQNFYTKELEKRRLLRYPPFQQLLLFLFRSHEEEEAKKAAEDMKEKMLNIKKNYAAPFEILGPVPSPLKKIKSYYRWQLLIKGSDLIGYSSIIRELVFVFKSNLGNKVLLSVDFDPYMML